MSYPGPVVCSFPLLVVVASLGCHGLLRSRSLLAVEVDRLRCSERLSHDFRVSYLSQVVCSFPLLVAMASRGCHGLLRPWSS